MRQWLRIMAFGLAGVACVAGAQQVDLIDWNGKKLAVLPPKTVVVGHPVQLSMTKDCRFLALTLSDMPAEPSDCVVGLFSGKAGPVKWSAMKNLRVVVIDLKNSTFRETPLPKGIMPESLQALGGGGFTLSGFTGSQSSENGSSWMFIYRFPDEPAVTIKSNDWLASVNDPVKPAFILFPQQGGNAFLYRPGTQPFRLTVPSGTSPVLHDGRVFLQVTDQQVQKVGAPRPKAAPTVFELDVATGRRIPYSEDAFRKLLDPFGGTMDLKSYVTFQPEAVDGKDGGRLYNLMTGVVNQKSVAIDHDLADGFGLYPLTPVLIVKGDAVQIREVREVAPNWANKNSSAKVREQAMSNAKQAAIAILLYAADYDGKSPSANRWKNDLMPYLKNSEVLKDFLLMMPGVNIEKIQKPAETVLGMITTNHGTAIAYADGHVVWKG